MPAKNCNNCSYCKSIAAVEVTGDEHAIKREFERIERNQKIIDLSDKLEALDYLKAKQAKSPSTDIDGL